MDRKIEHKKNPLKRILLYTLPAILLCLLLWSALAAGNKVTIDRDRVSIKTVEYDSFEDMALFNGKVQPLNTLQINTIESGTVKKIHGQNGALIKEGELLLELYNPNTELSYLTQETAIIEQINNLRNTRISIKNQQMTLDKDLIQMSYNFNNAERQYRMDTTLYRKGVISKNDYLKSKETFEFQGKQQENTKKYMQNEQKDRETQLRLINASIEKMEESLEQLRENKENFIVKAPATGLLSSFNPLLGKSYNKGELIGKLDMQDGYKLLVRADEYYYSQLKEGKMALLEFNDQQYQLKVEKVVAEVINGKFDIELVFEDKTPETIQQGMTLPIKIYLSNKKEKALLLPKGSFYQSSGGQYVFVLTDDNTAKKRKISIGKANANFYQVLEGLVEGDRVITSSYDDFKDKDVLALN